MRNPENFILFKDNYTYSIFPNTFTGKSFGKGFYILQESKGKNNIIKMTKDKSIIRITHILLKEYFRK